MITLENLEKRRDQLSLTLKASEDVVIELRNRVKVIKQEISNTKGAIIEINRMLGDD